MVAILPSWQRVGSTADSVALSSEDEPVPSDAFRASAMIDVRGLQITGSTHAEAPVLATGVSLSVTRGEVIGLIGAAGSGTREIALAIAGRLPDPAVITAGSIRVDGQELVGASPRDLKRLHDTTVSVISADAPTGLTPNQTIGRQLARTLRRRGGLSRPAAARQALELLETVGLPEPQATSLLFSDQLDPAALLQVTLASAVSSHPHLLVLDEPPRPLDGAGETSALEHCRGFQQEFGLSIIVVSRDLDVLEASCDRVAVVEGGRVVEQGSAAEIVTSRQHPHTRRLLDVAISDDR